MASPTDVCNIALSHLGARAQITSMSPPDGSVEAGYCARFYPLARREVIEAHPWPFTKARARLAEVDNPSTVWTYAYALPSDCMTPLRVLQLQYATISGLLWPAGTYTGEFDWRRFDDLFSERGSADFDTEDGVLLTNEPDAVLLYKRDATDTTRWSPGCVSAVGMVLAGYLAGPILKGLDGAKVGAQWRQAGFAEADRAAARAANGSSERAEHVPEHIAAR